MIINHRLEKHSINIAGHTTSITLEPEFWTMLKELAQKERISITQLITKIDQNRSGNLSGSIRLFLLKTLQQEAQKG